MNFPNHPVVRSKYAQMVLESDKVPFFFSDSPIDMLKFLDLDTLEYLGVDDIENGMDVQVTDGYDTYEVFGVCDVLIYNNEYLLIEGEDVLLFNIDLQADISDQKSQAREMFRSALNDAVAPTREDLFEKIDLPDDKDDDWFMGVDSSGYYFGEKYNE